MPLGERTCREPTDHARKAPMYETFEHTADVGLRISAADLPGLFAEAARGLFSLIVPDLDSVRQEQAVTFEVPGEDIEYLLFDWLNELLYRFDAEHWLLARFEVRHHSAGLSATAYGERLDPLRHRLEHEVKAITYHGLKVEQTAGGWTAEVIVDI
jgi:SHS2 domain-containing protein